MLHTNIGKLYQYSATLKEGFLLFPVFSATFVRIVRCIMVWKVALNLLWWLIVLGTVLNIVFDKGDSGRKAAWILIIVVLPFLGLFLYLCFGVNLRHHWLFNRRHQRFKDLLDKYRLDDVLFDPSGYESVQEEYRPLARLLASASGLPPAEGNRFEVIRSGARKFELLMQDLEQARESIHMEYFRFGADKGSQAVRNLLIKKAQEGVKVRVINENIGNLYVRARHWERMRKAGIEVVKFTNPRTQLVRLITRLNHRNHRKIVVVDGKIGYTGGMNLNDHYFHQWKDTHLRILGPAVAQLQFIFMDSWVTAGGQLDRPFDTYFSRGDEVPGKVMQIVPDEPDNPLPLLQLSYIWGLLHARRYFWLQTPYFLPPEPLFDALKAAAASGIDVRVILPRHVDTALMRPANKAYYQECLESGIRIYLREGPFVHSKTFVTDDYLSSIGTANVDARSFSINYEDNAYIFDRESALEMKAAFEAELAESQELTEADTAAFPWYSRLWQKFVRLFAPLL